MKYTRLLLFGLVLFPFSPLHAQHKHPMTDTLSMPMEDAMGYECYGSSTS